MSASYTLVPRVMTMDETSVDVLFDSERRVTTSGSGMVRHEFEHTYMYIVEQLQGLKERQEPLPMGDHDQLIELFRLMLRLHDAQFKKRE